MSRNSFSLNSTNSVRIRVAGRGSRSGVRIGVGKGFVFEKVSFSQRFTQMRHVHSCSRRTTTRRIIQHCSILVISKHSNSHHPSRFSHAQAAWCTEAKQSPARRRQANRSTPTSMGQCQCQCRRSRLRTALRTQCNTQSCRTRRPTRFGVGTARLASPAHENTNRHEIGRAQKHTHEATSDTQQEPKKKTSERTLMRELKHESLAPNRPPEMFHNTTRAMNEIAFVCVRCHSNNTKPNATSSIVK